MTDIAAAGDALNNPDMDEADIEDREDPSLDLSTTIDLEREPELEPESEPEPEPALDQGSEPATEVEPDPTSDPGAQDPIEVIDPLPAPAPDRLELESLPEEPVRRKRPPILLDQRPADVDDLQAINGISADIERRLNNCGCYHYLQIAELTAE